MLVRELKREGYEAPGGRSSHKVTSYSQRFSEMKVMNKPARNQTETNVACPQAREVAECMVLFSEDLGNQGLLSKLLSLCGPALTNLLSLNFYIICNDLCIQWQWASCTWANLSASFYHQTAKLASYDHQKEKVSPSSGQGESTVAVEIIFQM